MLCCALNGKFVFAYVMGVSTRSFTIQANSVARAEPIIIIIIIIIRFT